MKSGLITRLGKWLDTKFPDKISTAEVEKIFFEKFKVLEDQEKKLHDVIESVEKMKEKEEQLSVQIEKHEIALKALPAEIVKIKATLQTRSAPNPEAAWQR